IIRKTKQAAILRNLPPQLTEVFLRKTSRLVFSPDELMILYTASSSGVLEKDLVRPLPGASTQKEERNITDGHTYAYDIKEDKNFLISSGEDVNLHWFPNSHLLMSAEEGNIIAMDYDGTNRQIVYSGAYIVPFAYPFSNASKILILTNLGSNSSTSNLYSLTIK
ncbi:MAG: hypothetical protein AABY10_02145, partial [Nanoarchaeota archaeon]